MSREMQAFLEVHGLEVSYGITQVLWDIDLFVGRHEVVALIGPNGAGKTTMLRAISGILPGSGEITCAGESITGLSADVRVRMGIVQVPEARQLFPGLSVRHNLLLGAYSRPKDGSVEESMREVFTLFPELERLSERRAGNLSGGEQQMCAIGRALMAQPKILMIDELSWGLAPVIVERLTALVAELHERSDIAMLIVEQDVALALQLADRAYLLEAGRIVKFGQSQTLLEDPAIRESYLGI